MTYGLVIGLTIIATLAAVGWVQRRDVDTDWLTDVEPVVLRRSLDAHDEEAEVERALELGADLPPEPGWKPGQFVTLAVGASGPPTHVGYRRQSGGWHIFSDGYDTVISDETARNVEPVTVLTAEDARGVAARVAQRMVASGISDGLWTQVAGEAVEDEFRERGLDL